MNFTLIQSEIKSNSMLNHQHSQKPTKVSSEVLMIGYDYFSD